MKQKGLLLINLGTPASPSKKDVKHYLNKFLSDRRVIKYHPIFWQPILQGIILNVRPKRSAELYTQIYTEQGFPLLYYAQCQQKYLQELIPDIKVEIGMSYSFPSIEQALDTLLAENVTDLTIIPMYPQYSGTTVGSVFDSVMKYFIGTDKIIDIKFIRSYYDHPIYINYFVHKINHFLQIHQIDALLFSYHGIPLSYVKEGDKYPEECTQTTELIMQKIKNIPYYQTYQSKFGPAEWLTPATDIMMKTLSKQGIKRIAVVAPGFISDCLETIEELDKENRAYFLENGGIEYHYIPTFNDDSKFAELIYALFKGDTYDGI